MKQAAKLKITPPKNTPRNTITDVDTLIAEIMQDLRKDRLELPTLPQLAARIKQAVENDRSNAKYVAQLIGADPAVSARIIQVANSPLIRGNYPIENIQVAITRMGTEVVRNIVTAYMVQKLFSTKEKLLQQQLTRLWRHSTRVAAICHILAARYSNIKADEAMLAGLLHDIGKLPILAKARKIPNLDKHPKVLEVVLHRLHTTLGSAILKSWEFSAHMINAVEHHEDIQRDSESLDHTDIVLVANLLANIGRPGHKPVDLDKVAAFDKLSLDPDNSIQILKQAQQEIVTIQKTLFG